MQSIWKFPLTTTGEQSVDMPQGAKILACQTQNNTPCLWCVVDVNAPREKRTFRIYGTGHEFRGGEYVGTYQIHNGGLVFHVFEETS